METKESRLYGQLEETKATLNRQQESFGSK
jgi:hypothetical protein